MKTIYTTKLQFSIFIAFLLLVTCQISYAATVVIGPNTVISSPQVYSNVTLKMTNGSFVIKNKATLKIENCVIDGHISKNNPTLFTLEDGNLTLKNSTANIKAVGLNY